MEGDSVDADYPEPRHTAPSAAYATGEIKFHGDLITPGGVEVSQQAWLVHKMEAIGFIVLQSHGWGFGILET